MPAVSEVTFKTTSRQSRFANYILEMKKLKPGECVWIPIKGEPTNIHSTLDYVLRKYAPKPPRGYRWTKKRGTRRKKDGIAIFLVKKDEPGRVAKYAFGAIEAEPRKPAKKKAKKKTKKNASRKRAKK